MIWIETQCALQITYDFNNETKATCDNAHKIKMKCVLRDFDKRCCSNLKQKLLLVILLSPNLWSLNEWLHVSPILMTNTVELQLCQQPGLCQQSWHNPGSTLKPEWPEVAIFRQQMLLFLTTFPPNRKSFGLFFAKIAEIWAIPLPKFWFWQFLELFGHFWEDNLVALFLA